MYEETGAKEYDIRPICVYSVTTPDNFNSEETFGMLFYADVFSFEEELHSEIEKIVIMEEQPSEWTYPDIQPSPVFKLYLIKEFQRLKEQENDIKKIEWDAKRFLSKNNYLIQTDAVKNYLIPVCNYREELSWLPYAEEADLLNVALFGFTAKAWREANPELAKNSNVRDYSSINELTVLSNLETHNAQMIREGKLKEERFLILKEIAEYQIRILNEAQNISNKIEQK